MNRTFRIIKLIFLVLAVLTILAIPVVGLVSTAINYHGICHGFTDSQVPCAWWQFAGYEMFWSSFILIPLLFVMSIVWLGMSLIQFVASMKTRKNSTEMNEDKQDS